jgi:hypothetical protein
MFKWISLLIATGTAGLVLSGNALASGGNYVFSGGTPAERTTVTQALDASAFPWGLVPQRIEITIGKGYASEAWAGHISLDSDLLDAGTFAWGTIQHEYGHQVDYFLLDDAERNQLFPLLGGKCWFATCAAHHDELTSERFASTLAWSYWPQAGNTMKPEGAGDESAALAPNAFRALMKQVLGVSDTLTAQQSQTTGSEWATTKAKHKAKPKAKKPTRSKKLKKKG